jgi:4a-hydroxytetrahydrobiopterin dehydratase
MRTLVLRIVAAMAAAFVVGTATDAGNDVSWLQYSPAGDYIAVVQRVSPTSPSLENALHLIVPAWPDSAPRLIERQCASESAAWLDKPLRLVYGTPDGLNLRLIVRRVDGTEGVLASPPIAAGLMDPIGVRDDMIACVVRRSDGRSLCVWDLRRNRLSQWPVPSGFEPSPGMPPAISHERNIVAIVNADRSYFLAFRMSMGSWLMPVTVRERTWSWKALRARGRIDPTRWHSGWHLGQDKFLVDEKAATLWVVTARAPIGATRTPKGFVVLATTDELSPLDLDRTRELLSDERQQLVSFVWLHHIQAVSVAANFRRVAVVYSWQRGRDCLTYVPGPGPSTSLSSPASPGNRRGQVLVGDGSLDSDALSVSPDGTQVALVRGEGRRSYVEIRDTRDGRTVARWDVTILAPRIARMTQQGGKEETMALAEQKVEPVRAGTPPLSREEAAELSKGVPQWTVNERSIQREFKFKDFEEAIDFVNRVAEVAQQDDHHPDISISYNKVRLEFSTHKIGGLSRNDFILAAKVDRLV